MEGMMYTATTRENHNLIGSDRVEGTPVRSTDGTRIGTIERVMIDKLTGNIAYAVISLDALVGMGQKRLPIPWARLTYNRRLGAYHLDLAEEELSRAPYYGSDKRFDWGDREIESQEYYRENPYWGIAERW
jgi:hypothetical protein